MTSPISRRDLFKGLGAVALTGITANSLITTRAQVSGVASGAVAFYRFNVGDLMITAIKDGFSPLDTGILATNQEQEAVTEVLAASNLPTDQLLNTFNIMMIDMGASKVLVDTGLGGGAPTAGKLIPTLELLGITPADITAIIGTHWHPDHTNGLSTEGSANFPNAMYYFPQVEYDFVQENAAAFTGGAAGAIAPYADSDQLSLYNNEDEIMPGIQAVAAPGHTPGHTALLINSGGNQFMHMVDTAISAFVHVPNPTYAVQFDAMPDMATETRVALLSRAADEQIAVVGYHFPFPGVGMIARDNDTFRFVPYN